MEIVYWITQVIIFISLFYSVFWILVFFNIEEKKDVKFKKYPSVSILVPAFNEEIGIKKTLDSLLDVNYPNLKIFVINDASIDRTKEIVLTYTKKFSNISLIDVKKNQGKANALNQGLKVIESEYVGVVDADSSVSSCALKKAISLFYTDEKKNRETGAVICKMKPINNDNLIENLQIIQYLFVGMFRNLMANLGFLQMTNGVLSLYKTKIIKDVGGFDKNNLTEDFEAGVKVLKAGYAINFSYQSDVYTNTPSNLKLFMNQQIRWSRGFIQTHAKHRDMFFNPRYGWIGMYQFPLQIISPFLFFAGVFAIAYKIYSKLYEFVFKLIYTPDIIDWFAWFNFENYLLTFDTSVSVPIIFTLILFLLFFGFTLRFYDEKFFRDKKLKKFFVFVSYILYFNFFYIYVWIISIYREINKTGYDWGTKDVKFNKENKKFINKKFKKK